VILRDLCILLYNSDLHYLDIQTSLFNIRTASVAYVGRFFTLKYFSLIVVSIIIFVQQRLHAFQCIFLCQKIKFCGLWPSIVAKWCCCICVTLCLLDKLLFTIHVLHHSNVFTCCTHICVNQYIFVTSFSHRLV
jgi:hypothetical protein